MARNVEIKARIADLDPIRTRVASLASGASQTTEQTDTFFVVSKGRLKVRAFADGSGELIAYERSNQPGPKESVYKRVTCQDARVLAQALGRVLPVRGTVSKHREVFLIGRTRVHLDSVRNLGSFVELEVVLAPDEPVEAGHREARNLLASLAIPEQALVADAYIDLLENPRTQRF